MKAVVLAGGLRSGLEVPGSALPRALWPFPQKPIITHVLEFLKKSGCEHMAICANGKTKLIASELSNAQQPWTGLHYSEDPLPRGPAGCLRDLQDWLGTDTFIAIQGTAFYDFDLNAMLEEHRQSGAAITVAARQCPDNADLLEPAGVYLIEPYTLSLIHAQGYQDIKEQFLPKVLSARMPVRCHAIRGTAMLIHGPGHYLSAIREAILRAAAPDLLPENYRVISNRPGEPIVAHASATIDPQARLTGPLWIDAGAVVEANAIIAGPAIIGPGVHVHATALVHRTVAMKNAVIETNAEVFSGILGPSTVHPATTRPAPAQRAAKNPVAASWKARRPFSRVLSLFGVATPT